MAIAAAVQGFAPRRTQLSFHRPLVHSLHKERKREMMMMMEKKKMMVAVALALLVMISCNTVLVESDASDCYDGCSTACVYPDPRLSARCDRKCQIRCGPAAYKANEHLLD